MIEESLVSVCIPVYNREKFIKNAIESVLNQTYQNFEIIVVDDGSKDDSIFIVESFSDERIKLFKNKVNKGVVFTRNRYLEEASGDYIAILDSDDFWLPTKLEKQINFLNENPEYGICGTWAIRKSINGECIWKYPISDEEIRARLLWGSSMVHSSMVIKSSIIRNNSFKYCNSVKQAEDYDLLRQVANTKSKLCNLSEVLVEYNEHNAQFTTTAKQEQIEESFKISLKYIDDLKVYLDAIQFSAFKKVFTFQYNLSANELLKLKEFFEALNCVALNFNDAVSESLSKHWFLSCYHSTNNGLNTLKIFSSAQNEFPYQLTIVQKAKFYLKCLLKK
ncbi:glycosyltransferase family 2 protein [Zunongwangia sp. F260]|uniref:Glycosyltransferase family 2 protein n=1 Tax=Autumnicola lenta TaxID=3075593 RepID=A0ABU3CM60_9FLAO|nr:glycosyltransferase family 2 protein [Zunongwangia sp. F260]MDT0647438.1 glycosyltransferase family 2 protein [Zunongwangia sp. F260]